MTWLNLCRTFTLAKFFKDILQDPSLKNRPIFGPFRFYTAEHEKTYLSSVAPISDAAIGMFSYELKYIFNFAGGFRRFQDGYIF